MAVPTGCCDLLRPLKQRDGMITAPDGPRVSMPADVNNSVQRVVPNGLIEDAVFMGQIRQVSDQGQWVGRQRKLGR